MDLQKPKMIKAKQAVKWRRILTIALLALPCPECGTPLALHIWPLILPAILNDQTSRRAKTGAHQEEPQYQDSGQSPIV
jgi:hypothetical protein